MKMNTQQFGRFIAEQRKAKGYTQKELAEKLGVTDKAISRWENGHGYPDVVMLEPLAKELGVTIAELMHSKLKDDADMKPQKVDEAISNAIDITISNRKLERKTTILIYVVSILLLIGMSLFNNTPLYGIVLTIVMCIYAASGVGLLIRTIAIDKKNSAFDSADSKVYYAALLILVALGILLLLLCSSVSVVN